MCDKTTPSDDSTKPSDDNQRQGNRGNNRRGFQKAAKPYQKFEGRTEDLKGHIFDYGNPRQ